ncbi:MAG: magnesium transporter CorA family protein [Lachnospiraceae bacterium]|nr:magnesium transporter CorA family protein [Lachnospiraceae bacterium]
MKRIFKTAEDMTLQKVSAFEPGTWIALTNPTTAEMREIADRYEIDMDDIRSPLDEEERSRIQVEDDYTLIILDIPTTEEHHGKESFYTIPMGIIFLDDVIVTICLEDSPILTAFMDGRVRSFQTQKKTRFIYQILYRNATLFLQYLRIIDKKSDVIEKKMQISQRNQELLELYELEKSLVYFSTSLRGNEIVLERLMRNTSIPRYEEDEDLLEDVIIENKQAIEMAKIYSDILAGTMDTFASIISNNLNIVMKVLSVITIVLTVPTIISSAFGMNLKGIPLAHNPNGFWLICLLSLIITLVIWLIITKTKVLK